MSLVALGGTWLAAQGPKQARALCVQCLELGYGGIVPAPGTRPIDWPAFARPLEDLPLTIPAVRVMPLFEQPRGSLASSRADDVLAVRARVLEAARLAEALKTPLMLLDAPIVPLSGELSPGTDLAAAKDLDEGVYASLRARLRAARDGYLDRICRNLHRLCGDLPGFRLCLTESSELRSASELEDLAEILADLRGFRIGYWHRAAVCARRAALGGPVHGDVLENLSKYLSGSDLSDYGPSSLQLPPGAGGVDYGLVAPYTRALQTRLPTVVELDPACREEEVRQGRAFLGKLGL